MSQVDLNANFRIPLMELRNGEQSLDKARTLALSALEGRLDCLALVSLLDFTLPLLSRFEPDSSVHKAAVEILRSTEAYFKRSVFVGKTTIPLDTPKAKRISSVENLKRLSRGLMKYIPQLRQFPEVVRIITGIQGQISIMHNDPQELVSQVFTFVSNDSQLPPEVIDEVNALHARLFELAFVITPKPSGALPTNSDVLQVTSEMARSIVDAEAIQVLPHMKHPFTNFLPTGSPRLRDALSLDDDNEMCKALLQYATAVPRGNALWNNIFEVLFSFPLRVQNQTEITHVADKNVLEKIIFLRQHVGEHLFLPSIIRHLSTQPDGVLAQLNLEEYDVIFDFFLSRMEQDGIENLVDALGESIQHAEEAWRTFHPEAWISQAEVRSNVPISVYGHEHFKASHMKRLRRLAFADEAPYTVVRDHLDEICTDLLQRYKSPNIQIFIRELKLRFANSYENGHEERMTREMNKSVERINRDMGLNFLGYLDRVKTENEQVSLNIIGEITGKMQRGYALHPGVNDHIVFTGQSLPALLGFAEITFQVAPYNDKEFVFALRIRDANIGFGGHVALGAGGELTTAGCGLSAKLDAKLAGLEELIKQIVICSLSDLVTVSKSKTAKQIVSSTPIEPLSSVDGGNDGESKQRFRSLPRVRASVQAVRRTYTVSHLKDEVAEVMDKEPATRGKVIKPVDPYTRALPGARAYETAVAEYNAQPDEPHAQALELARRELQKPSIDKLTAPPILRRGQRRMIDPVTEQEVYLDTWVRHHFNPKPTNAEINSPQAMYNRFYRFGPALQLLNMHIWGHMPEADQLDKVPVTQ